VSLVIKDKQIITLIGPNGAGKSTLIKAILGFISKFSGEIIKHPRLKIGYMPQKVFFPEQIPINVMQFLQLNNQTADFGNDDLKLADLSINHLLTKSIHKLSGGELQRVLLVKALLNKPNLLILDEPTQGLDVNGQEEFYKLCASIQKKLSCAILMTSHDLHIVMSDSNSVLCLNKHICCQGLPHSVSKNPEFIKLFGNHVDKLAVYPHHNNNSHSASSQFKENGND
jgi:zinc transport system ATP-binding protein